MGRLSLARETGRVRVDAAQFAPKLLRAGSWNSEPLTFILSPWFEGRGGTPPDSTNVQHSPGVELRNLHFPNTKHPRPCFIHLPQSPSGFVDVPCQNTV